MKEQSTMGNTSQPRRVVRPAVYDNDEAVYDRLQAAGRNGGRIPFAEWCEELNVVRGPHPEPTLFGTSA
jgi:hypothetical protein